MRIEVEQTKATHEEKLRKSNEAISKARACQTPTCTLKTESAKQTFEIEMSEDPQRLMKIWPVVVREHASEIVEEAEAIERFNAELERVVQGYQEKYGNILEHSTMDVQED